MTDSQMLDWLQEFGVAIFQDANEKYCIEYLDKSGFPHQSNRFDSLRECIVSVIKENNQ